MDSNPADSTKPVPSLNDPDLVNTLVEELKSKGIFDQIRSDALAEVDTKVRTRFINPVLDWYLRPALSADTLF